MEITSGGYIGLRAQGGDLKSGNTEIVGQTKMITENVVITNTLLGISVADYASAEFNNTYSSDNWGNALYGHSATHIDINSVKFENCGGGALHIEDDQLGDKLLNPQVNIDLLNSDIKNHISGEEPWFKAYTMEVIALGMKSQIDATLAAYGMQFTCIKAEPDATTGLLSEKLNLIYLGRDKISPNQEGAAKDEGVFEKLKGVQAHPSGLIYFNGQRYFLMMDKNVANENFTLILELFPLQ